MNALVSAIKAPKVARTTNGMKALDSTGDACVNLFSAVGAMRGQDIIPAFTKAYAEDRDLALRIMLWARDARGGSGERQLFRDVLKHLESVNTEDALRLMNRTPELGRWDDLLVFTNPVLFATAADMVRKALKDGNGLAAKWLPRKGEVAFKLRGHLGMTPKQYRKTIVGLTNVVETAMCAQNWDNINFEHVPSLAAARYKKAFNKRTPTAYAEYAAKAAKGEAKINASAVFPYDVLKGWRQWTYTKPAAAELNIIRAQWESLPDYMTDANVLPVVDVSGSMSCPAGGSSSVMCVDVAVSLGLYCASKAKGAFKDVFVSFSDRPKLEVLKGDIIDKLQQMNRSDWGMSTNLHAVFEETLKLAVKNNVPQSDMPTMILIMSDMQFNQCAKYDDSAIQMIKRKYEVAGYVLPQIVFWNLNDRGNKPAAADAKGVGLVSGFSPAILAAVLGADAEQFTPRGIMMKTVMVPRYDV